MRTLLVVFLLSVPFTVMAQPASDSVDVRLDDYQWEHRLLFVFAPSDGDEALAAQEQHFEGHDAGFRDRDLLIITITGGEEGTLRSEPDVAGQPLTDATVERFYDQFDVPPDSFRVILVGKDGTEKRRNAQPVTVRSVFDTIDAMPMRQREMREDASEDEQ